MNINSKLVEQWEGDWWRLPEKDETGEFEYIAQRAADHALEEAAKVCEQQQSFFGSAIPDCICAIRAMKGTK